ncbi:MAG TPA: NACHT domain-containing protein, partial [Ktedonobacteraceae bacterium]|nr:NACHT domain-containing protein [Ktedonobacteraceae bacterium]
MEGWHVMPDVSGVWKTVETIWMIISGTQGPVPRWLSIGVGCVLAIVVLIWLMNQLLEQIVKVMEQWEQKIRPHFYNAEQRRRSTRRQRFAQHVRSRLEILNSQEDWKDYHFTELEAEVEAEGRKRFFWFGGHNTLRRERSLSKALEHSGERCILVEGEPGSGKSVALRHVALRMAEKAARSRSVRSVIPIYINLKELERDAGTPIDRNLIENFVLALLKQANDRDVEQFLDEEFHEGMKNGIWFFLFDSFDEIPEVLSSTDVDEVIKDYSLAISDFLHGMNSCRGIIASRQFRGPRSLSWPRFRVLALSEQRQHELIRKVNMPPRRERAFWEGFAATTQEVRAMASNPLFLSLLCEHMQNDGDFPQTTHSVFEAYIKRRFTRDRDRVQQRFQLDVATLRDAAEKIAFCMTADQGIGLNPTRDKIKKALRRARFDLGDKFEATLDALEYIKLARGPAETWQQEKTFTFAHRRFQEYFATCVVLANPRKVTARQLLTDARWRETAVTMCQMQAAEKLQALIAEAEQLLEQYCDTVEVSLSPPDLNQTTNQGAQNPSSAGMQTDEHDPVVPVEDKSGTNTAIQIRIGFPWPKGALHLLGLLQDGFADHYRVLPPFLRQLAGWLIDTADRVGGTFDRKWALEVAGITPRKSLNALLHKAFTSNSQWFKDAAYRQVAHVRAMTPEIRRGIYEALMKMYYEQRLWRERYVTTAHLKRLPQAADFLLRMKLLLWLPIVETSLFALLLVIDWYKLTQQELPLTLFNIPVPMFNILLLGLCSVFLVYRIGLLYRTPPAYKKSYFYTALAIEYPLKAYLSFILCWQIWETFSSGPTFSSFLL